MPQTRRSNSNQPVGPSVELNANHSQKQAQPWSHFQEEPNIPLYNSISIKHERGLNRSKTVTRKRRCLSIRCIYIRTIKHTCVHLNPPPSPLARVYVCVPAHKTIEEHDQGSPKALRLTRRPAHMPDATPPDVVGCITTNSHYAPPPRARQQQLAAEQQL